MIIQRTNRWIKYWVQNSFQPWWVARGHLLSLAGPASRRQADQAYQTAIGMTIQQRLKRHLESVRKNLGDGINRS